MKTPNDVAFLFFQFFIILSQITLYLFFIYYSIDIFTKNKCKKLYILAGCAGSVPHMAHDHGRGVRLPYLQLMECSSVWKNATLGM